MTYKPVGADETGHFPPRVTAALNATYVPNWKATTAYLAGDKVLSPGGDVVSAKVNFTSGASYSSANWDLSASYVTPADGDAKYARLGSVVRPVIKRTAPASTKLTQGGGTPAGTGTVTLADTTDFASGTSAVKILSGGTGAFRLYLFPSIGTWDLSAHHLRILIKVPDWTNVNELYVRASSDAGTGYRQWNINESPSGINKRILRPGEWAWIDLIRTDATTIVGAVNWAAINDIRVFFTDKNATAVTIQINGIERIPDPAGLPNGAVIFTCDDLHISHWTIAKPKLDQVGAPGVAFPIIGNVGGSSMSAAQLTALRDYSGWEIGAHAYDNTEHAAGFAGKTEAQLRTIFDRLKSLNAQNGFGSDVLAWPNGDSDTLAQRVAREYFTTARGTTNGTQSANYDNAMNTRAWGITSTATAQGYIDRAKSGRGIAQFVMHAIVPSGPTGLDTLQSDFEATVDYAVAQGVPIMTTAQVLQAVGK